MLETSVFIDDEEAQHKQFFRSSGVTRRDNLSALFCSLSLNDLPSAFKIKRDR